MSATVHAQQRAMGTLFEVFLTGDDEDHLRDVADVVTDEFVRLDLVLSRFDPGSEITRINRQAGGQPVRVDYEVWDLLRTCHEAHRRTDGYFDVTARPSDTFRDAEAPFVLDEAQHTVCFPHPDRTIDLGGIGKGYALDRAREILSVFRVESALLHGGTSSVLAVGGRSWPVAVRDPFSEDGLPLLTLSLADRGFSCSGVFAPGQTASDIVDPRRQVPLTEPAACVVLAPTATEAEVLSTACLCMGKDRARGYIERRGHAGVHLAWIDRPDGHARLTWLTEAP